MTLEGVLAKIRFWKPNDHWSLKPDEDFSFVPQQETLILNYISDLYSKSPTAATLLDSLSSRDDIHIGSGADGSASYPGPPYDQVSYFLFDTTQLQGMKTFTRDGRYVEMSPLVIIGHELGHMAKGTRDPDGYGVDSNPTEADLNLENYDYEGSSVRFEHIIQNELGIANDGRVSYQAAYYPDHLEPSDILEPGSYTYGNPVDIVRIDDEFGYGHNGNMDNSSRKDGKSILSFGLTGDDTIRGSKGNDWLYGGRGEDRLFGNDGEDHLFGQYGDDVLVGGAGNDVLSGGARGVEDSSDGETDTVDYSSSVAPIGVRVGDPNDGAYTTVLDGFGGTDQLHSIEIIKGTTGRDQLELKGHILTNLKLTFDANGGQTGGADILHTKNLSGTSGVSVKIDKEGSGTITDRMTDGIIQLRNFSTSVVTGSGDDLIEDMALGKKVIDAGEGNDNVKVGDESQIWGGGGDDIITGSDENDVIYGGIGSNRLIGGKGSDRLSFIGDTSGHYTGLDINIVDGGAGNDLIEIGGYAQSIDGGTGNDVYRIMPSTHFGQPSVGLVDGYNQFDPVNTIGNGIVFQVGSGHDVIQAGPNVPYDLTGGGAGINAFSLNKDDVEFVWQASQPVYHEEINPDSSDYDTAVGDLAMVIKATGDSIVVPGIRGVRYYDEFYDWGLDFNPFFADGRLSDNSTTSGGSWGVHKQLTIGSVAAYTTALADYLLDISQTDIGNGTSSDDELIGSAGDDIIEGGDGDDELQESSGTDTFLGGNGNDTVLLRGRADDYRFERFGDGGFKITSVLGEGADLRVYSVESVYFLSDLKVGDLETLAPLPPEIQLNSISGSPMDDVLNGTDGNDKIDGLAGSDYLNGHGGSDTYVYRSGDGNDVVYDEDSATAPTDTLKLADLNVGDVTFSTDRSQGDDVYFTVNATGERVRLVNQMYAENTLGFGVERVVFADGTAWDRTQIQQAAWFRGGDGDDVLHGYNGLDDTFLGGKGSDYLNGHAGSDTYVYRSGDGNDVVYDEDSATASTDTLKLADLNVGDVTFSTDRSQGDDVYFTVNATGERVRLVNQMYAEGTQGYGIEHVVFADGTSWDRAQLQKAAWFRGGGGDDVLHGYNGLDDTFLGGKGNDYQNGHAGSDTYVYRAGDGSDVVYDEDGATAPIDTLKLADLNVGDVTFSTDRSYGEDAYFTVNATGERVRLVNQMYGENKLGYGIERVVFAGGTVWNRTQIQKAAWFRGGDGDDVLHGYNGLDDTFLGGKGNDYLNGHAGSDTYVYRSGDGNDVVNDEDSATTPADTLKFADLNVGDVTFATDRSLGEDVYFTVNATGERVRLVNQMYGENTLGFGIERVIFADGAAWDRTQIQKAAWFRGGDGSQVLQGYGSLDNTFVGGRGNDELRGGDRTDTYIYRRGDGNDTISEGSQSQTSVDTLVFEDLRSKDLRFDAGLITVKATGETISIPAQFNNGPDTKSHPDVGIDQIRFSDGKFWDRKKIMRAMEPDAVLGQMSVAAGGYGYGGRGNDVLIGVGTGTAGYFGSSMEYSVVGLIGGGYAITDGVADRDGSDTVSGLDKVEFDDGTFNIEERLDGWAGMTATIMENAADGTLVGTVAPFGKSAFNGLVTFSLAEGADPRFVIDRNTGRVNVATGASFDHDSESTAKLDVVAHFGDTDRVIPLQIKVAEVEHAPTGIDLLATQRTPITYLYGSASQVAPSVYQLTPDQGGVSGNIWGTVDLSKYAIWNTRMHFGANDGGADGLAFSIGMTAQAPTDGGGGQLGVLVANSLGIRFDTYSNPDFGDPNSDFSAFVLNGTYRDTNSAFAARRVFGNVEDGRWHDLNIAWDPTAMTLSYTLDGTVMASTKYDISANLLGGGNLASFGFGASTGGLSNDQRVDLISLSEAQDALSVDTDAQAGALVGILHGLDANSSDTLGYTLVDAQGNASSDPRFEIANGDELRLRAGASLADLGDSTQNLRVRVTDQTGKSAISEVEIGIRTPGSTFTASASDNAFAGTIGSDTFVYHTGFGSSVIDAFTTSGHSHDLLQVDRNVFSDWAHLLGATAQVGPDLRIGLNPQDSITLRDTALSTFRQADVRFV